MTPPTERELQLSRLTGESVARLRYFMARGFVYDLYGNCTAPQVSTEVAARPVVDEPSDLHPSRGSLGSPLATLPFAPTWARRTVLHGLAGYGRGCRCGVCRDAQRVRMADYRQRRAAS